MSSDDLPPSDNQLFGIDNQQQTGGSTTTTTTTTTGTTTKQKKKRVARVRWTPNENRCLCLSWVTISEDPVVGDGQTDSTFWDRIAGRFNKDGSPRRTSKALKNRWQTINKDTQLFMGYHKLIVDLNESGVT